MPGTDLLNTYLEGWRQGDAERSLSATAPGFFYDDPNTCRVPRDRFLAFVEDFKEGVAKLNAGALGIPFLTYTDVLVSEEMAMAWCWWRATGTDFQGAAVIKFDDSGILSERIAYFSKLP